ncbi:MULTISPECIES: hypothetical protein [unclassified Oleiphilus]|uniref:hypothetical protein n=1 Tax=unclassified Oleiphilus TaxID=2631174 RepID=UPI0007C30106|nr:MULTISPECIES: hypothetical protein [unclassified Oleiphilus]KZZ35852.1 hypothetical protein A3757_14785 [Oleiphilus sp. HI0117]KZZ51898.1 hypothetical protein A3761_19630 [Oleiphilus sp. HI0123]
MKVAVLIMLTCVSFGAYAERFWTNELVDWHFHLNNGTSYVTSPAFPEECKYSRAQIDIAGDEYKKAMWSYILAASKAGEKLQVVLDHDRSASADSIVCRILSADARK